MLESLILEVRLWMHVRGTSFLKELQGIGLRSNSSLRSPQV